MMRLFVAAMGKTKNANCRNDIFLDFEEKLATAKN
jgi:hypothetical protein